MAVVEGDIIIGTVADLAAFAASGEPLPKSPKEAPASIRAAAIYLQPNGQPALWPDRTVYYTIDTDIPSQSRITQAIQHWIENTSIDMQPWTGQRDYVEFVRVTSDSLSCNSAVGWTGGKQTIHLGDQCATGSVIHEIGHAVGLEHEQSRPDRNAYVTVLYDNIDKDYYDQFHQGSDAGALGYYDYGSIMHYASYGFQVADVTTIQTVPPGIPIGQRYGLSAGDIDSVERLYGVQPSQTTITTIPEGIQVIVDGVTYDSPAIFSWSPGSQHTLEAPAVQQFTKRYPFVRWTNGGSRVQQFTASSDVTAVAAVYQRLHKLTLTVQAGQGTISVNPPSDTGYYPEGTQIRFEAHPAKGQSLWFWNGDSLEYDYQGISTVAPELPLLFNSEYDAVFTEAPLTEITSNPPGRQILISEVGQVPVPYRTPARFFWDPGSTHKLSLETTQSNFAQTEQYTFQQWEDGSTSTVRTVTVPQSGSGTFRADFETEYWLSTDYLGPGLLTPSSDYYPANSTVTLNATPNRGQSVHYWLGDTAGGGTQKHLLMDSEKLGLTIFGSPVPFQPFNAASYSGNPIFDSPGLSVAPLEIVTLFGDNIGPPAPTGGQIVGGKVDTTLANTRVLFDNVPAPMLFANSGQISAVVPASVAGKSNVVITVERGGVASGNYVAGVDDTLPGMFTANATGKGPVAAVNPDGSFNGPDHPAAQGSTVVLYATGAGLMNQSLPDGAVTGSNLSRPQANVWVRIGQLPAIVHYAGSSPGLVQGALQLNVEIPQGLLPGEHPIQLIIGQWASPPGTTITVE